MLLPPQGRKVVSGEGNLHETHSRIGWKNSRSQKDVGVGDPSQRERNDSRTVIIIKILFNDEIANCYSMME